MSAEYYRFLTEIRMNRWHKAAVNLAEAARFRGIRKAVQPTLLPEVQSALRSCQRFSQPLTVSRSTLKMSASCSSVKLLPDSKTAGARCRWRCVLAVWQLPTDTITSKSCSMPRSAWGRRTTRFSGEAVETHCQRPSCISSTTRRQTRLQVGHSAPTCFLWHSA